MTMVKLKVLELRKRIGVSQQELADVLGVSFQSVSKWEIGTTMPDITMLPAISEYFKVSVDELLGLRPLREQEYIPRNSNVHDMNAEKYDKLYHNRKYFWNDDYLKFLIDNVWHIDKPVDIIDFRCCSGYLSEKLLALLPKGSTYTGIDSEHFVKQAKENYNNSRYRTDFVVSDLYTYQNDKKYDIAICLAGLRHVNNPRQVLSKMTECIKKNGLVVCMEVNREFEDKGLYIEGMDYNHICNSFDYHKLWLKELEMEGRDYAIGMRIPFYMKQLGLKDIDVRFNDRVMYADPDSSDYQEMLSDFKMIHGYDQLRGTHNHEPMIEIFMSRGYPRAEIETYIRMQDEISEYFSTEDSYKSFLKVHGLLISYGRK